MHVMRVERRPARGPGGPTRYPLCAAPLIVDGMDDAFAPRIDSLWHGLFAMDADGAEPAPPPLRFQFVDRGALPEDDGPTIFESAQLVVRQTAAGYVLQTGASSLHLDLAGGQALASLAPSFWDRPFADQRELFLVAVVMLLHARGRYALHATAVARNGTGVLFAGPSGSGKTTAALTLIRAGWRYLSDDALVVHAAEAGVRAVALRRGFSCSPATAALLEGAAASGHPLPDGKRLVDLHAHVPGRFTPRCSPQVLVFPHVGDQATSELSPMSETDALLALLPEAAGLTSGPGLAVAQLGLLQRLVHQCQPYRLRLGADALTGASPLAGLLEDPLDDVRG